MRVSAVALSKQIHFFKSIIVSNFQRLNFPFKLGYIVTYRCNMKCGMCNIWKKPLNEKELTLGEVENFFRRANRFSWVSITGGESFLRKDLPELIDIVLFYCDRLSVLHFATNGQLTEKILDLRDHIRKRRKDLRLLYTVSIDGPESVHDEIRGVDGAWKRAVSTFKFLNRVGANTKARVNFTLSKYNTGRFEDFFASLRKAYPELRFDDIAVNMFQRSSFYYNNQEIPMPDDDDTIREINKILEMDKEKISLNNFLRRTYLKLYLKHIKTQKCPLECKALSSTCVMDPYGDIFPCSVYNKRLLNIRNLKESFANIWNSDSAKKLSYECSNNICPSCWTPCDANSAIAGSLMKSWITTT